MNTVRGDRGFGDRLRQRREERHIDLIAISEQTKIKLALLEALERGDVSHWPAGLFRRAYIRAYAQMIGLDPDDVVREFLEVHPDPGDVYVATAAAAAAAEGASTKHAPPTRLRTIVDSAIDSLTRLRRPTAGDGSAPAAVPPRQASPSESIDAAPASRVTDGESVSLDPPAAPVPVPEDSPVEQASVESMRIDRAAADTIAADLQSSHDATFEAVARLSTELGRVEDGNQVQLLLQDSARTLQATGLIVWLWEEDSKALRPALVHGYSDKVLAHLPPVMRNDDNATAAAFRDAHACEVAASPHTTGALVVPMLIPGGCAGVLAIELQPGAQPTRTLRALAMLVAAALSQLVNRASPADRRASMDPPASAVPQLRPPVRAAKATR